MIPVDTPFWEDRFQKTCGYLMKDAFVALDICNARFRYKRSKRDDGFPITFTKKDYRIIRKAIKEKIGPEEFWAAVVAPTDAFFEGDWREYAPRGEMFRQMQLCRLLTDDPFDLSEEEKTEIKKKAIRQLEEAKVLSRKEDVPVVIPKKMKRRYRMESYPSREEVFESLEEID